jgi:hypothetical protein
MSWFDDAWGYVKDRADDVVDWADDNIVSPLKNKLLKPIAKAWDRNIKDPWDKYIWEPIKPSLRGGIRWYYDTVDKLAKYTSFGWDPLYNIQKKMYGLPMKEVAFFLAPDILYDYDRDLFNFTRVATATAIAFATTGNPFIAAFVAATELVAIWQENEARKDLEDAQKLNEEMRAARSDADAIELQMWCSLQYYEAFAAQPLYHKRLITGYDDPMTRIGFDPPDKRIDWDVENMFADPYANCAGNGWIDTMLPSIGTAFTRSTRQKNGASSV